MQKIKDNLKVYENGVQLPQSKYGVRIIDEFNAGVTVYDKLKYNSEYRLVCGDYEFTFRSEEEKQTGAKLRFDFENGYTDGQLIGSNGVVSVINDNGSRVLGLIKENTGEQAEYIIPLRQKQADTYQISFDVKATGAADMFEFMRISESDKTVLNGCIEGNAVYIGQKCALTEEYVNIKILVNIADKTYSVAADSKTCCSGYIDEDVGGITDLIFGIPENSTANICIDNVNIETYFE